MTKIGRILGAVLATVVLTGCGGNQQPKAYVSELTSSDSVSIQMGQWTLLKYHSDRLGMDINYPSFLVHQDLPDEVGLQELFIMDDISVSVMVDSLRNMMRSPGQTMMAMGADLGEVGDDYTIQEGVDDKWEYYSKVLESDSLRLITVILRYYPEHAEAVEPLKEWVRAFEVK
ncbi:MAG: hypothetical protein IJ868_09255 [Prevotella sp.]|nr:hypothetical protein [Prevotella sp.]